MGLTWKRWRSCSCLSWPWSRSSSRLGLAASHALGVLLPLGLLLPSPLFTPIPPLSTPSLLIPQGQFMGYLLQEAFSDYFQLEGSLLSLSFPYY